MYWEMSSDEDSDDNIKHLLKLNPSKPQKGNKICFMLFCNGYSNIRRILYYILYYYRFESLKDPFNAMHLRVKILI